MSTLNVFTRPRVSELGRLLVLSQPMIALVAVIVFVSARIRSPVDRVPVAKAPSTRVPTRKLVTFALKVDSPCRSSTALETPLVFSLLTTKLPAGALMLSVPAPVMAALVVTKVPGVIRPTRSALGPLIVSVTPALICVV